ncbi:MAG TPA: nucleotidyltransferase family protein [Rhabdochlamydiaceae bacterium]|nr:nucleotidyltransferase family protein [Rhabdochlamydiaceae bacterium]
MQLKRIKKILIGHKKHLSRLGVRALALFGSVARNEATSKSDVDILIDVDSKRDLFAFVEIKSYLEGLLDCEVDLVTKNALHPALKDRILREAKYVF